MVSLRGKSLPEVSLGGQGILGGRGWNQHFSCPFDCNKSASRLNPKSSCRITKGREKDFKSLQHMKGRPAQRRDRVYSPLNNKIIKNQSLTKPATGCSQPTSRIAPTSPRPSSCQAAREMGFEALNALVHEEIAFKASDWQSSTASSPCGATTRRQTAAGFPSSS